MDEYLAATDEAVEALAREAEIPVDLLRGEPVSAAVEAEQIALAEMTEPYRERWGRAWAQAFSEALG